MVAPSFKEIEVVLVYLLHNLHREVDELNQKVHDLEAIPENRNRINEYRVQLEELEEIRSALHRVWTLV